MSHTTQKEKNRGHVSQTAQVPFLSLPYIDDDECARTTKLTRPFPSFFLSPFPTCSSHLWPRSFNSKIDVTACVLGLLSLLNHVRCSRASNDRYSIQEKKHFYTQPPVSTFCVVATFFFSPSLHTRPFRDHQRDSFSMPVCAQAFLSEHTHSWRYTLSFMFRRRRRYSFLFLSSSSFPKARERRRISPAIFLVSFMSTRKKKKKSRERYRETKPQKTIITLCVHKL